MYYSKLKEVDQRIEAIANWRDKKLDKLNKKEARVLAKAARQTQAALKELGLTIPDEVKENKHGESRNSRTDSR